MKPEDTGAKRHIRRLGAGETLFKEGERDGRVYILVQGRVEVLRGDARVAEIDVADTFIGEISALTEQSRTATVRTLEPSTLLVVEEVEELFHINPDWGLKLARVLARRLARTSQRLEAVERELDRERQSAQGAHTVDILEHVTKALRGDEEDMDDPSSVV